MMMVEDLESKVLGQRISHPTTYDSSILVAIPRKFNRTDYKIDDDALPFVGNDIWHAYELSFLTEKGLPVAGVLKLIIPCSSPCLVESKSLKLYLNSFNMSRYGSSKAEGLELVLACIRKDLSELLSCTVEVSFIDAPPSTPFQA